MNAREARLPKGQVVLLFVVSTAMLMSEIALLRLFEHNHWHHFAAFAVSLALLGLGASATVLSLTGERGANPTATLVAGALIQSGGILVLLWLHTQISVRPLFAAWDWSEARRLLLVDLAAFIPFFGAGLVIGRIFMSRRAASGTIYAANLIGAGCGSLAASAGLAWLDVEVVLALAALLPALIVCGLPMVGQRRSATWAGLGLSGVALTVAVLPPETKVSDFKILSQILALPDAEVVARQPGLAGTLTVVRSQSLRFAPGLSLEWEQEIPSAEVAVIGSDQAVALPRGSGTEYHEASLAGIPFSMRPNAASLILGTSLWQSLDAAGTRETVWVEEDGRLIRLFLQRDIAGGVNVVRDSPYRFLATTEQRFGLVLLDLSHGGR